MAATLIFTSIVLLAWNVPYGLKFFAWTISGVGYAGQATNFVWCNLATRDDDQLRAVTLASMNMWSNVMQAWFPIVFFPSSIAPRFHRGWYALIVIAILTVAIAIGTRYLELRDLRASSNANEIEAATSPTQEKESYNGAQRRRFHEQTQHLPNEDEKKELSHRGKTEVHEM